MKQINSKGSSESEDQEMADLADDPSFQEMQENHSMKSASTNKRGRKPVPQSWSRIINLQDLSQSTAESFVINDDINEIGDDFIQIPNKGRKQWKPLFHPKSYWSEHQYHDLDSNKIGKRALKSYAKDVGEKRQLFNDRALAVAERNTKAMNEGFNSAGELSKKLQNRGTGKKKSAYDISPKEYIEPTDIVYRKKGKRRPKLTVKEKIMIVYKVIHEYHSEKEVAKEFRITQSYVS